MQDWVCIKLYKGMYFKYGSLQMPLPQAKLQLLECFFKVLPKQATTCTKYTNLVIVKVQQQFVVITQVMNPGHRTSNLNLAKCPKLYIPSTINIDFAQKLYLFLLVLLKKKKTSLRVGYFSKISDFCRTVLTSKKYKNF